MSLVEDMSFENNRLEFQIYLCNWKQTTYEKQEDEMKNIKKRNSHLRSESVDVGGNLLPFDLDADMIV